MIVSRQALDPFVRISCFHVAFGVSVLTTVLSGCGTNLLQGLTPLPTSTDEDNIATLEGNVDAMSAETGLPSFLTGALTGDLEGTYEDQILEVFTDADGALTAATSKSVFGITGDQSGTLTSINSIVLVDFVLMTDGDGIPVVDEDDNVIVVGIRTASVGEIIHGTGDFEGMTGNLQSDSTVMLTGGENGLGTLSSTLTFDFDS